ncbi:hypothetical protein HAX54_024126 [Datura stramonium]|uniref:BTB domain-containing protein n=1 Tax=Datura stramonium TaxID=4076 RepID=A0ABS8UXR7_DATST|nr:hypothetical protein [Datura stramonium]
MDFDFSPGYGLGTESDFGFAFNDSNFSDRILVVEIVPDSPDSKSNGDGCSSVVDWARKRKRRREEIKKENDADVHMQREEEVLNCNMLDTEDVLAYDNQDEEAVAMAEESPSGIEMTTNHPGDGKASKSTDSTTSMDSATALRVRTIHISSPILAAKSPFFYKLFSNGMRESEHTYYCTNPCLRRSCPHGLGQVSCIAILFIYDNTHCIA